MGFGVGLGMCPGMENKEIVDTAREKNDLADLRRKYSNVCLIFS